MIYGDLTSPDIRDIAPKTIALLPIAATEQHGNHLPVITDTAVLTELSQRVEKALPSEVALLPTLWVGSSHHHAAFAGTMSISSDTYILVLKDLALSLLKSGFKKIVFLNGHGGNTTPLSEALYRIAMEPEPEELPWVVGATYWVVASQELAKQDFMDSPRITHACEYETSMMLGLRTDWVKMDRAACGERKIHSKFYDPLFYNPARVAISQTFAQMTATGAMGSPEKGTKEKGDKLLSLITDPLVEFFRELSTWKLRKRGESAF